MFAQRLYRTSASRLSRDSAASCDRADLYPDADVDSGANPHTHTHLDAIADAQPHRNGDPHPIADAFTFANAAAVYPYASLNRGRAAAFLWSDARPFTNGWLELRGFPMR